MSEKVRRLKLSLLAVWEKRFCTWSRILATLHREIVAERDERFQAVRWAGTVEEDGNPVAFVHVVSWENARFSEEGFDEVGVGFEVDDAGGGVGRSGSWRMVVG